MAIIGIASLLYGVDDVAACTRFFDDFGLKPAASDKDGGDFSLADGSEVMVRALDDAAIPASGVNGIGVREVIWGVDTAENLSALCDRLSDVVELAKSDDGVVRFLTPCGLPMGLKVFNKKPNVSSPDPVNAPDRINRLNIHRRWRDRARPKAIGHVVFAVPNFWESFGFFEKYLDFRLSDYQRGFGVYARCDGSRHHHNIFFLNANAKLEGMDGKTRFHHANFSVEDIDEIMIGANHMTRCGWEKSHLGLGRHRVDSALFYYIPCPAGGEAEYGADGDAIDDDWVPREWINPLFGYLTFAHNVPPFLMEEQDWAVRYYKKSGFEPDEN